MQDEHGFLHASVSGRVRIKGLMVQGTEFHYFV